MRMLVLQVRQVHFGIARRMAAVFTNVGFGAALLVGISDVNVVYFATV